MEKDKIDLIENLRKLEETKKAITYRIQSLKAQIKDKLKEDIQQYVDMFVPGTIWCLNNTSNYVEYFKVNKSQIGYCEYIEEDLGDVEIDIYGSYIRLTKKDNQNDGYVNVQYQKYEMVSFKIREIPNVSEITKEKWNEVLNEIINSEKI